MIPFGLFLALIRLAMAFDIIAIEGHLLAGYTAIAHVYIGVLGCDWWHNRFKWGDEDGWLRKQVGAEKPIAWCFAQPWQWHFFWFMCAVEVFSFAISRLNGFGVRYES